MNLGRLVVVGVIGAALGAALGYWAVPQKVMEREVVKWREAVARDVVVREREVVRPDGTKEREVVREEKSVEVREAKGEREKLVESLRGSWQLRGGVKYDSILEVFEANRPVFWFGAERRVFGDFYVGAWGALDGEFGVGVTLRF